MTRPTRDQAIRDRRRTTARAGRWPVAHDKPVDIARTLANHALALLEELDAAAAKAFRDQAHACGQTWLGQQAPAIEGPWLTRAEVAELARVKVDTVSQWTSRGTRYGHLTRHPNGKYAEREVLDLLARMRTGTHTGANPQEEI